MGAEKRKELEGFITERGLRGKTTRLELAERNRTLKNKKNCQGNPVGWPGRQEHRMLKGQGRGKHVRVRKHDNGTNQFLRKREK